jgi:ankyrin repeat protein
VTQRCGSRVRLRRLVIVAGMDASGIVRLLAEADAGRIEGPVRAGGFAVVAYIPEADVDEEDEDYDEDLVNLEVWGTAASAAEAFDLLGEKLAERAGDSVDETVAFELELEDGVAVDDFDRWFEGGDAAVSLLQAKPTDGRKMLMFLLYDYYASMEFFDVEGQFSRHLLDNAAKLFTGARLVYAASAAPPYHEDAMGVFELQPTACGEWPNALDDRGMSPLNHAVASGDAAAAAALLEAGADPDLQAGYGNSPLFAAVDERGEVASALEAIDGERWAITKALLDRGADVNARDRTGRTLVDLAVQTVPYPAGMIEELHARGGRSFVLEPATIEMQLRYCYYCEGDGFLAQLNRVRYVLEAGAERRGLLHQLLAGRIGWAEFPPEKLTAMVALLLAQGVRDEAIDGSTALDLAWKQVAAGNEDYRAVVELIEGSAPGR